MEQCLYEFGFALWKNDVGSAYLLDVDRETEKMLYGVARRLDYTSGGLVNNAGGIRFQLSKNDVAVVSHRKDSSVSVIRVFADDFFEAKSKAVAILSNNLGKWVNSLDSSLENQLSVAVEHREKQPALSVNPDIIYLLSGVHNTRFGSDGFAFVFRDKDEALNFKVTDNITWREDERDEDEWIEYRVEEYRETAGQFKFVEAVYESGCYYASDEIDKEAEAVQGARSRGDAEREGLDAVIEGARAEQSAAAGGVDNRDVPAAEIEL